MWKARTELAATILLACLALAATGQEGRPGEPAEEARPLHLEILRPAPGLPLFGEVTFEVAVEAAAGVREVTFLLDGREVGLRRQAPYRIVMDVGDENRDHRLRAVAVDREGREAVAEQLAPGIHIDEDLDLQLQLLYVSLTDRRGQRVLDVGRNELAVFDDEAGQEIVTFERGNLPLAAVVLVDGSLSMQGERLAQARRGVGAVARSLAPLDEATLLVFTDAIEHLEPLQPGSNQALLENVEASGGTAINDHLYLAMQHLETRLGRRVVILLSDGRDNHSILTSAEVREVARESQAMVYWLRLEGRRIGKDDRPTSAWRDRTRAVQELNNLGRIARESGGRVLSIDGDEHIGPAFEEILAELREQYALGYYPTETRGAGSWHTVRIEVSRPGLEVRHRDGYYER